MYKRGHFYHDIEVDVSIDADSNVLNIHVSLSDQLLELCHKHKHLYPRILETITKDIHQLKPISDATQ